MSKDRTLEVYSDKTLCELAKIADSHDMTLSHFLIYYMYIHHLENNEFMDTLEDIVNWSDGKYTMKQLVTVKLEDIEILHYQYYLENMYRMKLVKMEQNNEIYN